MAGMDWTKAGRWGALALTLGLLGCGARSHPGFDDGGADGRTVRPDGGVLPDGRIPPDGGVLPDGRVPPDGGVLPDGRVPPDAGTDATMPPPPVRDVVCDVQPGGVLGELPAAGRPTGLVAARLGDTALIVYGWASDGPGSFQMRSQQFDLVSGRARGRAFDLGAGIPVAMQGSTNFGGEGFAAYVLLYERPGGRYSGKILSPRGAPLDSDEDPFPLDNVDPPVVGLSETHLTVTWNRASALGAFVVQFARGREAGPSLPTDSSPGRPSVRPRGTTGFDVAFGEGDTLVQAALNLDGFRVVSRTDAGGRIDAVRVGPGAGLRATALVTASRRSAHVFVWEAGRGSMRAPVLPSRIFPEAFGAASQEENDVLAVFGGPDGGLWGTFLETTERIRTRDPFGLDLALAAGSPGLGPEVLASPLPADFGYTYFVFALERRAGASDAVSWRQVLCPLSGPIGP